MTSTGGTEEHVEVAEISALAERLLPRGRMLRVREHLESCELCADIQASLGEIRGLLGTLPGPTAIPADVAGRIDAALAAEALLDSAPAVVSRETTATQDRPVSRETGPPSRPRRAFGGSGAAPRTPTGPGHRNTKRRRSVILATICAVATLSIGGLLVQSLAPMGHDAAAGRDTKMGQSKSDASTFTAGGLGHRVQGLLDESRPAGKVAPSPELGAQSSPDSLLSGSAVTVPSCVREGISRTEDPIAAEPGTYRGASVYLVVLPHASDARRVAAYVVDSSCTDKSPSHPGEVLLARGYPRR